MKNLASMEHDAILRDNIESVMHFSWDTVFRDLNEMVSTLIKLMR